MIIPLNISKHKSYHYKKGIDNILLSQGLLLASMKYL